MKLHKTLLWVNGDLHPKYHLQGCTDLFEFMRTLLKQKKGPGMKDGAVKHLVYKR